MLTEENPHGSGMSSIVSGEYSPKPEAADWSSVLKEISELLRKKFVKATGFEEEGEVSPTTVALRDAFYSFPYRTDVLVMDSNDVPTPFGEERWWTVIRHDFTEPHSEAIRFHGTFTVQELRR